MNKEYWSVSCMINAGQAKVTFLRHSKWYMTVKCKNYGRIGLVRPAAERRYCSMDTLISIKVSVSERLHCTHMEAVSNAQTTTKTAKFFQSPKIWKDQNWTLVGLLPESTYIGRRFFSNGCFVVWVPCILLLRVVVDQSDLSFCCSWLHRGINTDANWPCMHAAKGRHQPINPMYQSKHLARSPPTAVVSLLNLVVASSRKW